MPEASKVVFQAVCRKNRCVHCFARIRELRSAQHCIVF